MTVTGSRPRVVTIVLNTSRRDDTLECLASLERQTAAPQNHVIVLDNNSVDQSIESIRSAFPTVEILPIERDGGYAGNNNVGIGKALTYSPEWIFVLNEDTILDSSCLAGLLEAGSRDSRIGIVGPMVLHHDEPSVIQSAGGRLGPFWDSVHEGANQEDLGQFQSIRDVDWISGCALMIRSAAVEQCGMLDERFYYYWEEVEWCLRVRKGGWTIVHVPNAKIWHKGVRRNYSPSPNVTYYSTRNHLLIMSRHSAPLRVRAVACYKMLRTLVSWSVRSKWRSKRPHRDSMLAAIKDFAFHNFGPRSH
jgi:GT2 family glycosyltransferase